MDYLKQHPYMDKYVSEFDAWFYRASNQLVEEELSVLLVCVADFINKLDIEGVEIYKLEQE